MHPFPKLLAALLLLIILTRPAQAQVSPSTDSIDYYRKAINAMYKKAFNSLRQSDEYKVAAERFRHHLHLTNAYAAFTAFGNLAQASYDVVNKGIAQSGFPPLKGPQAGLGFGITREYRNRWILDFSVVIGDYNTSKKGDSSVKCSFRNVPQVNIGYDFIKSTKVNLYPYAGLGGRVTNLKYQQPDQVNDHFTSIVDIVQKEGITEANKFNLAYQVGLGVDVVVSENKQSSGIMLFLKGGTDGVIGSRTLDIHGVKYNADIKQGAWSLAFGVKLFGRN
jgi:opacity protein-like surface antigen